MPFVNDGWSVWPDSASYCSRMPLHWSLTSYDFAAAGGDAPALQYNQAQGLLSFSALTWQAYGLVQLDQLCHYLATAASNP